MVYLFPVRFYIRKQNIIMMSYYNSNALVYRVGGVEDLQYINILYYKIKL